MSAFSASVTALLKTYDECLAQLKSFKRRSKRERQPHDDAAASALRAQSRLWRSLKSDRSRVEQAYSSSLSLSGKRLEEGDEKARSTLRRVAKRLSSALSRIVRTASRDPSTVLNYESLAMLSNSSSVDAINAINQLSSRLSMVSTNGGKQVPSKHRRSKSQNSHSSSGPSRNQRKPDKSTGEPKLQRYSVVSFSSDSTKLGEISRRSRHRRHGQQSPSGNEEVSLKPVYPLRPYYDPATVERERRGGLLGWFSSRRGTQGSSS